MNSSSVTQSCGSAERDSASQHHVLVADDDSDFRQLVSKVLHNAGYRVTEAASGAELIECLRLDDNESSWTVMFDVVVTDVRMPGVTGLSVAEALGSLHCADRVILISAFADDRLQAQAARIGVPRVLAKPFSLDLLITAVQSVLASKPAGAAGTASPNSTSMVP